MANIRLHLLWIRRRWRGDLRWALSSTPRNDRCAICPGLLLRLLLLLLLLLHTLETAGPCP